MEELNDYIYNDNPVHDMEVDYDFHIMHWKTSFRLW